MALASGIGMLVAGSPKELFSLNAGAPEIYDASLSGVRGDAGDYTVEFREAVAIAAQGGVPLRLPAGAFSIATDTTIDLTGIPEVIGHGTTIDCTRCTALDVFGFSGSKTLLKRKATLANGASTVDLPDNEVELSRGDTIIVTSVEQHPNYARDYYYKGTRTYVDSVVDDQVRLYPQIDFDYSGTAYIWKVEEEEITISGVTILGNPKLVQTGLRLRMANASVDANFRYFSKAAVRFETSQGTYTGSIRYPLLAGSGNDYGVSAADLSDVAVSGAFITGARHAVAVGGGTMFAAESGGRPISEDVRLHGRAAYPSSVTITGGKYGSSRSSGRYAEGDPSLEVGAIDSHGIGKTLNVTGAVIYGGLSIAAIESAVISGNTIYNHNFPALNISDSVNPDWGSIAFRNNTVIFIGASDPRSEPPAALRLFTVNSASFGRNLDITNNLFRTQVPATDDQIIGFIRNFRNVRISGNRFDFPSNSLPDLSLRMGALHNLAFSDNELLGVRAEVIPQGSGSTVRLSGNTIRDCPGAGLQTASYSLDPDAKILATLVHGNVIEGCLAGIDVRKDLTRSVVLDGNIEIPASIE